MASRKFLPSSDPQYIISLLEGNSSDESDSDSDEDSYFITDSPSTPCTTNSFQSYSSLPLPSTSSFQSYSSLPLPSTSSFQSHNSLPLPSTKTSSFQSYSSIPLSLTTTSSFQSYTTEDTGEAGSSKTPLSPPPLPPPLCSLSASSSIPACVTRTTSTAPVTTALRQAGASTTLNPTLTSTALPSTSMHAITVIFYSFTSK